MHSKAAQKKPANHKKTSRGKTAKRSLVAFSKTKNLEANKGGSGIRKSFTTHKGNPQVINHFS